MAIKVASTQEGQALSCTQEWLEEVLKEMERLSWGVESLQYKYDKYRETALNRIRELEQNQNELTNEKIAEIRRIAYEKGKQDGLNIAKDTIRWFGKNKEK